MSEYTLEHAIQIAARQRKMVTTTRGERVTVRWICTKMFDVYVNGKECGRYNPSYFSWQEIGQAVRRRLYEGR